MDPTTMTIAGLSLVAIIFTLVGAGKKNQLWRSPKVTFLLTGLIWAVLVALWGQSEGWSKSPFVYVVTWMAGWALTVQFSRHAKDNEQKPGPP